MECMSNANYRAVNVKTVVMTRPGNVPPIPGIVLGPGRKGGVR